MQKIAGSRLHKVSDDGIKALRKAIRMIRALRAIEARMPTSYAHMFLAVAAKPGKGPTEYAKDLGIIQPHASRLLLDIGRQQKNHEKALGLVDRQQSPESLAKQEYFLTDKGFALAREIISIINGED